MIHAAHWLAVPVHPAYLTPPECRSRQVGYWTRTEDGVYYYDYRWFERRQAHGRDVNTYGSPYLRFGFAEGAWAAITGAEFGRAVPALAVAVMEWLL